MLFSFEIIIDDVSIGFKNLDLDCLKEISDENVLEEICKIKFYQYGVYDKIEIVGKEFMFLKCSKKSVILLKIRIHTLKNWIMNYISTILILKV